MHIFSVIFLQIVATSLVVASPIKLQGRAAQAKCYTGTDFPATGEWLTFSNLFDKNRGTMLGHDSEEEVKYIEKYIHEASRNSGIDARIILAVVMQESHGNLRTSAGGGITPGIMQALGSPHCETTAKGKCDENTIKGMINAGVFGTDKTPGLKACYEKNGRSYGAMLRCYNSGSIPDPSDLTKAGPGTPSYVSDVANRLKGMEPAKCWF